MNESLVVSPSRIHYTNDITFGISVVEELGCGVKGQSFSAMFLQLHKQRLHVTSVQKHRLDNVCPVVGPDDAIADKVICQPNRAVIPRELERAYVLKVLVCLVDLTAVVVGDQEEFVLELQHCEQ